MKPCRFLDTPTFSVLCGAGVAAQRFEMQLSCNRRETVILMETGSPARTWKKLMQHPFNHTRLIQMPCVWGGFSING